jgi:hypothetical protein
MSARRGFSRGPWTWEALALCSLTWAAESQEEDESHSLNLFNLRPERVLDGINKKAERERRSCELELPFGGSISVRAAVLAHVPRHLARLAIKSLLFAKT